MKKLLMTLPVVALLGCSTIPDGATYVEKDGQKCVKYPTPDGLPTPEMGGAIGPIRLPDEVKKTVVELAKNQGDSVVCVKTDFSPIGIGSVNLFNMDKYIGSLSRSTSCFRFSSSFKLVAYIGDAADYNSPRSVIINLDSTKKYSSYKIYQRLGVAKHNISATFYAENLEDFIDSRPYSLLSTSGCLTDIGMSFGEGLGKAALFGALGGAGAVFLGPIAALAPLGMFANGPYKNVKDLTPEQKEKLLDVLIPKIN